MIKNLRSISCNLLSVMLIAFSSLSISSIAMTNSESSDETISKYLLIEGSAHKVFLVPKSLSKYNINQSTYTHPHYDVHVEGFPSSEGRATQVEGQWQGILFHQGKLQIINDLADDQPQSLVQLRYAAIHLPQDTSIGRCGNEPEIPASLLGELPASKTTPASLGAVLASRINYDTFCDTQIDGVCLVAELGVIFDSEFKTKHFGNTFQTQAISILEEVDLIYKENFHIVFNRINLDFNAGDTLDDSLVINDVLESLALARFENQKPSYDINNNSMLHFVTGRDYTSTGDSAIGLAFAAEYSDSGDLVSSRLCTPLASGTTQVVGDSNREKVHLTALTVAHELGHNFGFLHDGDTNPLVVNCPEDGFIMTPYLETDLTTFSSCSRSALLANIGSLSRVENCFDLPFDLSMSERNDTVTSAPSLQPFTTRYDVNFESKSSTGSVLVTGTLNGGGATFTSAAAESGVCSLSNANQTYACTLTDPQPTTAITLIIDPTEADIVLEQQAEIQAGQDLFETDSNNNTITSAIETPEPGRAPANLTLVETQSTVVISWLDQSSDETGFNVERSINNGSWIVLATGLPPDTQRYTDSDLISGERFSYRVTATFSDGNNATSDEASIVISTQVVQLIAPSSGGGGGSIGWISLLLLSAFASLRVWANKTN